MEAIAITCGMLWRLVLLCAPSITKDHILRMFAATSIAAIVGATFYLEFNSLLSIPIIFLLISSFLFKEKLLPKITEGTLLLYSLLALYLVYEFHWLPYEWARPLVYGEFLLLGIWAVYIFVLCLFRIRISQKMQVFLMIVFLLVSLFVGILSYTNISGSSSTLSNYFIFGIFFLQLFSGVTYIIQFIPITYQRMGEKYSDAKARRREQIAKHAEQFAQHYIDIDLYHLRTIGIVLIVCALFLNSTFAYTNWLTAFSLTGFVGTLLALPPKLSSFTPQSTY